MSFLTSGAFTSFTANTKAKSAEVNSNFSALYNFLNTITSDVLVGSVWQKLASTAASHTITSSDSIRTLLVNVNTSAGYTVTLPTAAASAHRRLTIKNIGATTGALIIDGAGSETIDGFTTMELSGKMATAELHCDGSNWHVTNDYDSKSGIKTVSSAAYTITDVDGLHTILVSTGGSNRTITLPAVANNKNRMILIKKTDSAANTVTVDTPGAETIDGVAQWVLASQYAYVKLVSDGSNWHITERFVGIDYVYADTGHTTPKGTTDTQVRRFTNHTTSGNSVTAAGTDAAGSTYTINYTGLYAITYSDRNDTNALDWHITRNSTTGTNAIATTLAKGTNAAGEFIHLSATVWLDASDVIRFCSTAAGTMSTAGAVQARITRLL